MDKLEVIKALQIGVLNSIEMLEWFQEDRRKRDPIIDNELDNLRKLLTYSEYIYDENPNKGSFTPSRPN